MARSRLVGCALLAGMALSVPAAAGQLTVLWDDNSDNETGFKIERAEGSGAFAQVGVVGPDVVSYIDTTVTDGVAYTYRVCAYNAAGNSAYTNAISNVPSIVTQPPAATTVAVGGNASFSVTATGAPVLTYRWRKAGTALNDGVGISGTQTATLTLTGVTSAAAGSYSVVVSNGVAPDATSGNAVLTVAKANQTITFGALAGKTFGDPPFPVSATSSAGLPVNFAIVGGPATIAGATITMSGAGTVSVRASQPGNADYNAATAVDQSFDVAKASQTITFPALAAVAYGDAPFTLAAVGGSSGQPLVFVSSHPTVAQVSGSTVTITGAGTTTITASQSGNADFLAAADISRTLDVTKATQTVTFAPLDPRMLGDLPFNLTAVTTSGLPISFSSANPGVATISGTTVSIAGVGTTTVTAAQPGNANYFPASATQVLTVYGTAPSFTTQPAGRTIAPAATAIFSALATGVPAPTYQWQQSVDDGVTWTVLTDATNYSGTATSNLAIGNVPLTFDGYQFRCLAANGIDPVATSNIATLNVSGAAPLFTTQPVSATIAENGNASFTVAASGTPTPTLQWQASTDSGVHWSDIADGGRYGGATSSTLSVTGVPFDFDGYRYRCVATNDIGTDTSVAAILAMTGSPPSFDVQPSDRIVTAGETATFAVAASGAPDPTLRWQISTDGGNTWSNLSEGSPYSGVTTSDLTVTSTSTSLSNSRYRVVATNVAGVANSNAARLTVNASAPSGSASGPSGSAPVITTPPQSASVALGSSVTFAVTAAGNPAPSFQWMKDNAVIDGATSSTLAVNNVTAVDAGAYAVRVFNNLGSVTSASATLIIEARPVFTLQPQNANASAGESVTLTAAGSGSPPLSYQWQKNGAAISGATTPTLTLANLGPSDSAAYTVTLTNPAGSTTSDVAVVGVDHAAKLAGQASEVGHDILHPNGNIYDQVLLTGRFASIKADAGQVIRLSFIDLNEDIVQVEFSGAGTLTLTLTAASGPALPAEYNQQIAYVKGHAGIVIAGADETSNVSIFSVGIETAVDQSLFKSSVHYDGIADIAFLAISTRNGKFGGLRAGNVNFFNDSGFTGVSAKGVDFAGPVNVGDVDASGTALPRLITGFAQLVEITGGDLLQENKQPLEVSGIKNLRFVDGTTSQGVRLPAQVNQAQLEQNGVDVTKQLMEHPSP